MTVEDNLRSIGKEIDSRVNEITRQREAYDKAISEIRQIRYKIAGLTGFFERGAAKGKLTQLEQQAREQYPLAVKQLRKIRRQEILSSLGDFLRGRNRFSSYDDAVSTVSLDSSRDQFSEHDSYARTPEEERAHEYSESLG